MGKFNAVGGGFILSLLLGTFCAILIAVLWYLAIISIFVDIAEKNRSGTMPMLFGVLTVATAVVSAIFVPYYSFGYSHNVGLADCEAAKTPDPLAGVLP